MAATSENVTVHLAPLEWEVLKDIDVVSDFDEKSALCVKEVGEVIRKHGLADKFGLTLIHKHFELDKDEVLVETIDVEERTLQSHVRKEGEIPNTVPTSWMFVEENGQVMERCPKRCIPTGTATHGYGHAYGRGG